MKNLRKPDNWMVVSITILVCLVVYFSNHPYMKFKSRKCIVLDKLESIGRYRGNFHLVLKTEDNVVFDMCVSPATYSQASKGKVLTFKLRGMDIQQTAMENIIYFFGLVLTVSLTFLLSIAIVMHIFNIRFFPKDF